MERAAGLDSGGGGTGVLAPPRPRSPGRVDPAHRSSPPSPPPPPPRDDGGGGGPWGDEPRGAGGDGTPASAAWLALALAMTGITVLFGVFLAVWLLLRKGAPGERPGGFLQLPGAVWTSSAVLLASSATLARAARLVRVPHEPGRVARLLTASLLLGLAFLASQGTLWWGLIDRGLVPSSGGYMATFFSLTGLHGLHVVGGLLYMGLVRGRWRDGQASAARDSVRLCASYWHFMGVVWIAIFVALALLG